MDPGGNWAFKEKGGAYEVCMKMNSLNFYCIWECVSVKKWTGTN